MVSSSAQVNECRTYVFVPPPYRARKSIGTRVLIIDDRELYRDCMSHILSRCLPGANIQMAEQFEEVTRGAHQYDLLIVCIEELGDNPARELRNRISSLQNAIHGAPPIALVVSGCEAEEFAALQATGVAGIFLDDCSMEILAAGLSLVAAGGAVRPTVDSSVVTDLGTCDPKRRTDHFIASDDKPDEYRSTVAFTKREGEIIVHLHNGTQNKIIAHEMHISESTVKVHLRNIMKKLNATNRTQVALFARRMGLMEFAALSTKESSNESQEHYSAINGRAPSYVKSQLSTDGMT
jgi:DNA-binding NarL/FixJ family response regulator